MTDFSTYDRQQMLTKIANNLGASMGLNSSTYDEREALTQIANLTANLPGTYGRIDTATQRAQRDDTELATKAYVDGTFANCQYLFAVAALNGTATFVFTGLPSVGSYSLGSTLTLRLWLRDTGTGARKAADIPIVISREGSNAGVNLGTVNNWLGSYFGAGTGTEQVAATCASDGTTLTVTVLNTNADTMGIGASLSFYSPVIPLPGQVALGDSLTANGTPTWTSTLATSTAQQVLNRGVGGETSAQIAARAGGIATVLNAGIVIPASGAVACATSTGVPSAQGGGLICYIAGVRGTITYSSGAQSFTRTTAGTPIVAPVGTAVIFDEASLLAYRTQILWVGRNDDAAVIAAGTTAANVATIVGHGRANKSLVLSLLNASNEPVGSAKGNAIVAHNTALAATYDTSYLDIRTYLITSGLAALSLTPTGQDTTDIANGVVPTQLRVDTVHLTQAAIGLIAAQVYAKEQALGWAV